MDDEARKNIGTYVDSRDLMRIWDEDITPNEAYLAQKVFREGSVEDCRKWGNHLLRILKSKAGIP